MKQVVGVAIVAMLMVSGVSAQGKNFGGTWTIDSEKTAAAGGGAVMAGGGGRGGGVARSGGGGGVAVGGVVAAGGGVAGGGGARGTGGGGARGGGIAAGPMTVSVDAKAFSITQGENVTAYALDGSVKDLSNEVRKASAKASWQGDKVVIETTTETPNGSVVTTASWYLEGEWLVRENTSAGPDGPISRKTYYKKA